MSEIDMFDEATAFPTVREMLYEIIGNDRTAWAAIETACEADLRIQGQSAASAHLDDELDEAEREYRMAFEARFPLGPTTRQQIERLEEARRGAERRLLLVERKARALRAEARACAWGDMARSLHWVMRTAVRPADRRWLLEWAAEARWRMAEARAAARRERVS